MARDKIAQRVRAGRIRLKISQQKAADQARIGRETWNRYEAGCKSIPSEILPRVANAIKIPVATILGIAA